MTQPEDKLYEEIVFAIIQSGTCDDEEQARIGANACMVFVRDAEIKAEREARKGLCANNCANCFTINKLSQFHSNKEGK